ncbi:MAG: Fic family protein [Armatimonadetes bacterium]|nr:Fic family protein [Armatimonadota bacterium]
MSRYSAARGPEAEYEPGSRKRVLRNKLGIKSKSAMDTLEAEALADVQIRYFSEEIVTEDTRFTADLIRQMHRDWLGGIYEWAGSYRTVDMSKGGFVFPPAYRVADNMATFERDILRKLTPCRPRDVGVVCEAVARVHAEFLLIHPFREGNGRLARWLANIMFAQAGMTLPNYGFVGRGAKKRRSDYLSAVIKGYFQDYFDLVRFFERALERGYASDLSLDSDRGDAPSKMDDS